MLNNNGDVIYFEDMSGDVDDYAERLKPLVEVDFKYLWAKLQGSDERLTVGTLILEHDLNELML